MTSTSVPLVSNGTVTTQKVVKTTITFNADTDDPVVFGTALGKFLAEGVDYRVFTAAFEEMKKVA